MSTKPWFSPVSDGYARNFAEVEFARERFSSERDALLDHLATLTTSVSKIAPRKEDHIHRTYYVDANDWWKLQNQRGKKAQTAGYVLTLGDYDAFPAEGRLVFAAHAFFQAGEGTANQLRAALVARNVDHVSYWGCVRLVAFRAVFGESEFQLERFEAAARELPAFFEKMQAVVVEAMGGLKNKETT